ncbi:hypothetical protein VTP01DRAFT_5024, partial [Rhizomucor pusillus]|uniref:uncharacterized protein n=1 Tax=Rhizomucor pusillus TaxID=4840 RepID=UPI003744180F
MSAKLQSLPRIFHAAAAAAGLTSPNYIHKYEYNLILHPNMCGCSFGIFFPNQAQDHQKCYGCQRED